MKVNRKTIEMVDDTINGRHDNERLFPTIVAQCSKVLKRFDRAMREAGVQDKLRGFAKHLTSNPILLVVCLVVLVSVAIPISIFVLFAVVNVAFVFTSFLVIEVTVLSIATAILCCILFCIISTITAAGVCVAFIYYPTYYVVSLVKSRKSGGKRLDLIPKLPGQSSRKINAEKSDFEEKTTEPELINSDSREISETITDDNNSDKEVSQNDFEEIEADFH